MLQMLGSWWKRTLGFRIIVPRPPQLAAVAVVLLLPEFAMAAEPSFPRGPGFYYNAFKVLVLIGAYLGWVATCNWVDRDAQALSMPTANWNSLVVGLGFLGLVLVWMFSAFWLPLILLLLFYVGSALAYIRARDQAVPEAEKILTKERLQALAARFLKLQFGRTAEEEKKARVPVRFIGRSANARDEDTDRVARAQDSKGYKGALLMVYEASKRRATDIHLEPTKAEMTVRLRIDGIMVNADPFTRGMGDAVINIFKVLSNLDITEKRKPQDGSFSAQIEDHRVDFRVATAGSVAGEKMVMRILDTSQQIVDLTQIGMRDKMRDTVRSLVKQPHGMFIVCGPTGSGKSTTLYACLNEIDRYQQNIITIENPVEYQLENVTQIEVNPKAGKTFASELRSILRQDPDVIMIGEIRDKETAEIACQAAQTGHFVFSTLHANDTTTAIGRLIDLGVQPFMIASALTAVLGQRLVRLLCPKCKVRYKPNPELLRKANLPADKIKFFYRPPERDGDEGEETCEMCGSTGYFKRTGVFELFVINDKIRELIRENPNITAIKQEAVKSGMRYLYEDGLRQVIEGRTSIQELLRVSK